MHDFLLFIHYFFLSKLPVKSRTKILPFFTIKYVILYIVLLKIQHFSLKFRPSFDMPQKVIAALKIEVKIKMFIQNRLLLIRVYSCFFYRPSLKNNINNSNLSIKQLLFLFMSIRTVKNCDYWVSFEY